MIILSLEAKLAKKPQNKSLKTADRTWLNHAYKWFISWKIEIGKQSYRGTYTCDD